MRESLKTFVNVPTRTRELHKKGFFLTDPNSKAYLPSPDWLRNAVEHPLTKIGRARGLLIVQDPHDGESEPHRARIDRDAADQSESKNERRCL